MREVDEVLKQQYFRVFGNKKYHIARKTELYYFCLCGNVYPKDASATPISQYVGDECMSCRHATSKKVYSRRRREWVLEVKIRRANPEVPS
jgi:hypothetical protein